MTTKKILRRPNTERKRVRFDDDVATTVTLPVEVHPLSAEDDLSTADTLPAEYPSISGSTAEEYTSSEPKPEPGSVEIVRPSFNRPCRVYSRVIPCESDPMVRRTLCERIKITVGNSGGESSGGGNEHRHQPSSSSATTTPSGRRPTTKVFYLHRRLLCEYSEYFGTALSPRNRDVFIEADTGHFVLDDDGDDPDDFYRWAVWLYVCSWCKLSAVYEFQDDHRCRPSRLEEESTGESKSTSSESKNAAGEGEEEYRSYGLPQPPPCMSISNQVERGCHHRHRRFDIADEEQGKGRGVNPVNEDVLLHTCHEVPTVTGWFCAGDISGGGNDNDGSINDPNAPLEAAAAYMFGYRILSREYRLFALAHFIQHVEMLTKDYQDELLNLLDEVFPVGSEAHRFLTAWVAWLRWKQRLPSNNDDDEPSNDRAWSSLWSESRKRQQAYWEIFRIIEYQKGSEAADPRRYPLYHWEQEWSKGPPAFGRDGKLCVHIESLGRHGEVVEDVVGYVLTEVMTGQPSAADRPRTAREKWDNYFEGLTAMVAFCWVSSWLPPPSS